jgi:hypothetical protein
MNLLISARESYKHMVKSGEIDSSVDMFMDLAEMMAENDGGFDDNEEIIFNLDIRILGYRLC